MSDESSAAIRETRRDWISEHREMFEALTRVSRAQDASEGGRELEKFCERMLAHMTWEEKAFLNATVLRDDDQ